MHSPASRRVLLEALNIDLGATLFLNALFFTPSPKGIFYFFACLPICFVLYHIVRRLSALYVIPLCLVSGLASPSASDEIPFCFSQ